MGIRIRSGSLTDPDSEDSVVVGRDREAMGEGGDKRSGTRQTTPVSIRMIVFFQGVEALSDRRKVDMEVGTA